MTTSNNKPAIIVVAYNRPEALNRLLNSIKNANIPNDTELVISIDYSGDSAIEEIALDFAWDYGNKRIIAHSTNLGLREHILQCGNLTEEYGNIILLEDDLFVSPYFYQYTVDTISFYENDENIGGISLYDHRYNEYAKYPFIPLDDGYDNYFLQIASSWGQAWTKKQWSDFRSWYDKGQTIQDSDMLPKEVKLWPESSWKKYFIKYLVETNKYFIYPRVSHTTNFGDMGTHHSGNERFQVQLAYGRKSYNFSTIENAMAVYDTYCEIRPEKLKKLLPRLEKYDFECDFYGSKEREMITSKYILTSKDYYLNENKLIPVEAFGLKLKSIELNIVHDIEGSILKLYKVDNIFDGLSFQQDKIKLFEYFYLETKFISSDVVLKEIEKVPKDLLFYELIRRIKNRIKYVFTR